MKIQKIRVSSNLLAIMFFTTIFGLMFAVFSYYTIISLPEIYYGSADFLKLLVRSTGSEINFIPVMLIFKGLSVKLSFLLAFLSFSVFSSFLSGFFYNLLAEKHNYIDIDVKKMIKKIATWQFYRYSNVFLPITMFFLLMGLIITASIIFFDTIMTFIAINSGILSFIAGFFGFSLLFLLSFAVLVTLWNSVNYYFGTEIAISEPELEHKTIARRSGRLVFGNNANTLLFLTVAVFLILLVLQIKTLNLSNPATFFVFFAVNIIGYAGIKYLKTSAYINSLLSHYEKMKLSSNSV